MSNTTPTANTAKIKPNAAMPEKTAVGTRQPKLDIS